MNRFIRGARCDHPRDARQGQRDSGDLSHAQNFIEEHPRDDGADDGREAHHQHAHARADAFVGGEQKHIAQRQADDARERQPEPAIGPGPDRQRLPEEHQIDQQQIEQGDDQPHPIGDHRSDLAAG